MITALLSLLFLLVGICLGWMGAERYAALMEFNEHEYEELFKENPHPELFDKDGELHRGEYTAISFDPGFDPEEWDPETDIRLD